MASKKNFQYDLIDIMSIIFSMLIIFMMVFSLILFAQNAYAGTTTDNPSVRVSPGPATLTGSPEINVTVNYTGDDVSSNNSVTIEWGLDGVDFSLGSQNSGTHPASPYSYAISPLDNSEVYQVRITVTDPDNVPTDEVRVYNGMKAYNPLLHNAVSTGSGTDKWPTGWGTTDGQYGEFTCAVCHEKKSGNIKRIRKDWSEGSLPDVPAKLHNDTIEFNSTVNGSAEFALDDSTDHATSNRICEACHTKTAHHQHDESVPGGADHQSSNDCIDCHSHSNAFAPSGGCSSCHGGSTSGLTESNYWPDSITENSDNIGSANDSGEHQIHMARLADKVLNLTITELLDDADSANKQLQLCNYCHENPGSDGDHMSGDDAEVTRFLAMDGTADSNTAGTYSGSCSSVDCHNGKASPSPGWYAGGSTSNCLMCHTEDSSNGEALLDPTSGLHYNASPNGVVLHDSSFGGSGGCTSCHTTSPSDGHFNNVANAPDTATYAFQSSASIDIKLNTLGDATDATCAADCHSDTGVWYRAWSTDAFDATAVNITQALPERCNVCHGVFMNWAEGSSHAKTYQGTGSIVGNSHNSQNPIDNPGAACEDCHNYPSDAARHENGKLTVNDDTGSAVDPVKITEGFYCSPCHSAPSVVPDDYPPELTSEVIPLSVFPEELVDNGSNYPIESCFSGAMGCHGDKQQRWWPSAAWPADPTNPAYNTDGTTNFGYPNRAGSHPQHNVTLGARVAETRTGIPGTTPTDQDYNATCRFCHPMEQNEYATWVVPEGKHRDGIVDMFGGSRFDGANEKGLVLSGDPVTGNWTNYNNYPNATDGYLYQLDDPENPGSLYPLDHDVSYRQYLYEYRNNSAVNHGTCSQVACHSNSPFTPQWYGDEQPPAAITDLAGSTHDMRATHVAGETDVPGTILLTWTAPGDNGDLDGTAYEYEVYYSTSGSISDANVGSATRVGGAPTVYRKGQAQEMKVDGLTPGANYWVAVRTKDQPRYKDTNADGIYETFVADGNLSPVASVGSVTAHPDDVKPLFWGIDQAVSHDTGGEINLSWGSAKDHTLPLTYRIYWSEYSLKTFLARNGVLPNPTAAADSGTIEIFSFGENGGGVPSPGGSDYEVRVMTTHATHYQIKNLSEGVLYNFMVRAEDGASPANIDDNNIVSMVLPKKMPVEPSTLKMFLIDNSDSMRSVADLDNITEWPGTSSIALSDSSNTWVAQTPYAVDTNIIGISFDVYVSNSDKTSKDIVYTLGHTSDTAGSNFLALGGQDSIAVGKKSTRLQKVSLYDFQGKVPQGRYLALTIGASGGDLTFTFGDSNNKGQLLVNEQIYNHEPSLTSSLTITEQPNGGYLDINWGAYDDEDGNTQSIHYDVFGSSDGGSSYPYVVATGLTGTNITWDTVGDGLTTDGIQARVKLEVGEETQHQDTDTSTASHYVEESANHTLNNGSDDEPPAPPTITHIEPRPKQGTTYLHWLAVGNDGYNHGTRAAYYDVRSRKVADGALTSSNWNDAATIQAEGEPVPGFSGHGETFELLDMTPDTDYMVAVVACDAGEDGAAGNADDNCSGLSNIYPITSGQYYCGICHSTPPDEPDTGGVHRQHGYTLEDCAKCHGDGTSPDGNNVNNYDGRHYDGVINIGWAEKSDGTRATLVELAAESGGSGVTLTQNNGSNVTIYTDPDGAGGYNAGTAYNSSEPLKNTDSGKCINFGTANATGCHGPFQPKWASDTVEVQTKPTCADCHGDKSMAMNDDSGTELGRLTDPYGRQWDQVDTSQTQIGGIYPPQEELLASPPIDNHNLGGKNTRYTGAHLRHLNASFRFAKGDSCRLCHKDTMDADLHANRVVDIIFDGVADQDDDNQAIADDTPVDVDSKGISCSSLNNLFCHDTGARWAEPGTKCNNCHGMGDKEYTPGSSPSDSGMIDLGHVSIIKGGNHVQCTSCHYAGHPQSPDGKTPGVANALLIENYPAVGISYRSGGIHLKNFVDANLNDIPDGGETQFTTLAELCWDCHDQNDNGNLNDAEDISEWGTNQRTVTGNSPYDYGSLNQSSWVGATWSSGYGQSSGDPFFYKQGPIQSTHSTNLDGTSQIVAGTEVLDTVANIRCSNCHDVHDLNRADDDTATGAPYLRGSWKGNPYEEDGAPYTNRTYTQQNLYGQIPRGGVEYDQLGGYYIDQNNAVPGTGLDANPTPDRYPTSGWTIYSSSGLCILCHGDNVDTLDQRTGENLWLGSNGHSNSALGGSFINSTNIFDYTHGRPTPVTYATANSGTYTTLVPDMGTQAQGTIEKAKGLAYRGVYSTSYTGSYLPGIDSADYAYADFDWGCSVDNDSTDVMFHQFSCSKCHNPHASRLPKLMTTNCLDIRHNSWDDNKSSQTKYTANASYDSGSTTSARYDRDKKTAYYDSAQNCHRYDGARANDTLKGGWNRATPW